MKKSILLIITLSILFTLYFFKETSAAGMKIGATTWYAWWDTNFKNVLGGYKIPYTFNNKYKINAAPLYGPILAFDFTNTVSLSIVFTIGNHYKTNGEYISLLQQFVTKNNATILKYDLDPIVTFALHKYVKIFLGLKLQGSTFFENGSNMNIIYIGFSKSKDTKASFIGYGPGAGLGFTFPLYRGLYLLWNLSGIYLRIEMNRKELLYGVQPSSISPGLIPSMSKNKLEAIANTYGANTSLSFAYVISPANVTISLGFRYQVLRYAVASIKNTSLWISTESTPSTIAVSTITQNYTFESVAKRCYNNQYDHFYGILLSVIYSIDFTRKKPELE